jgi:hypothetical protein
VGWSIPNWYCPDLPRYLIVDVVKSRLQVVSTEGGPRYKGTWDCVVQSYRNEGIGTFYRGIAPAMFRAAPVNAAVYPFSAHY